jgi:hypothetical protein
VPPPTQTGLATIDNPEWLLQFLADQDVPCPGCGYNLRGLTTPTCPECAQALTLRVGLTEPRLGMFSGLLGAAAGLGFHGLLLLYMVVMIVRVGFRGAPPLGLFLVHNVASALVMGLATWLWCARRAAFRRGSSSARKTAVGLQWLALVGDVVLFSFLIR